MQAADKVVITTLVENYVDMLIPNTDTVKRPGLAYHFDLRNIAALLINQKSLHADQCFSRPHQSCPTSVMAFGSPEFMIRASSS